MKTNNVILWKERFADRAASGLKVEDWCKTNGIKKSSAQNRVRSLFTL